MFPPDQSNYNTVPNFPPPESISTPGRNLPEPSPVSQEGIPPKFRRIPDTVPSQQPNHSYHQISDSFNSLSVIDDPLHYPPIPHSRSAFASGCCSAHPTRQMTTATSAMPDHSPHHPSPNTQSISTSGSRDLYPAPIFTPRKIRELPDPSVLFPSYASLVPYCAQLGIDTMPQLKSPSNNTSASSSVSRDGPTLPLDVSPQLKRLGDARFISAGKDDFTPLLGFSEPMGLLGKGKQIHREIDGGDLFCNSHHAMGACHDSHAVNMVDYDMCASQDHTKGNALVSRPEISAPQISVSSCENAVQLWNIYNPKGEKENQRMLDSGMDTIPNENNPMDCGVPTQAIKVVPSREVSSVGAMPKARIILQSGMKDKYQMPASRQGSGLVEESLLHDKHDVGSSGLWPDVGRSAYTLQQKQGPNLHVHNYQHYQVNNYTATAAAITTTTTTTTTTTNSKFKKELHAIKNELVLCKYICEHNKIKGKEEGKKLKERFLSALAKLNAKSHKPGMTLQLLAEVKLGPLLRQLMANKAYGIQIRGKAREVFIFWEMKFRTGTTRF